MKKSIQLLMGLLVSAFALSGVVVGPAVAQDKAKAVPAAKVEKGKPLVTTLVDNDKVRAQEVRYKPGDVNANVPRAGRVIRYLTSGALLRTYPDGKTEKVEFKAGDVRFNEAITGPTPQYTTKNVGKTDVVFYVVILK